MTQTALILGATGRFGRAADLAFQSAGWTIRRFDRMRDTLEVAASGADVIVNGWNPPYTEWAADLVRLHDTVAQAAVRTGATVLLAGNVYVFGAQTPTPWSDRSAHGATHPLGRLRIQIEEGYRKAGGRTVILRGGDFLDTSASGNWFDRILAKDIRKGRFVYPGPTDIPHAWAYLPDMARAAVDLCAMRADLPAFSDIPFPGFTLSGADLADGLARVTGQPVTTRPFPWWQLTLAQPVWPMARHLLEMRYLWSTPHQLDGARLSCLLPDFRATDLDTALAAAAAPL